MNERSEHEDSQRPEAALPVFAPIQEDPPTAIHHSGLGIASFVIAMFSIVAFIGLSIAVVLAFTNSIDLSSLADANGNPKMTEEELIDKFSPMIGYFVLYPLLFVLTVIGLILGIVGLAQKRRKKLFAILGTVFNALPSFLFLLLILIGIASAASGA
jgi:hypothetical protein